MMNTVRIRRATLADLPLLLGYRRAMAEEMEGADEAAVNRMIATLEPYLRTAIAEDRWHSWIAEPGGCGSVEIVQWVREGWTQRRDVRGYTACILSLRYAVVVLDASVSSPKPSLHGLANAALSGSICTPVIKAGLCMNRSDSCRPAKCASNSNEGRRGTRSIDARFVEMSG